MDATYREIVIRLSPEDAELYVPLLEQAAGSGTLEQYLSGVVAREGRRLWYIERSKPKPSAPKTPVGRPRIEPTERQRRELVQFLETIYVKLMGLLGDEFQEVHGKDMARLQMLKDTNDLPGLEAFAKEQPWQKIRSGK